MELFSRDALHMLTNSVPGPCVSIFLPTHRAGREIQQDPIRLKNLLALAEEKLTRTGVRGADAKALLAPAFALQGDTNFWRHQSAGLGLFVSRSMFHAYRVPLPFEELVSVSDRFHVKPLMPLLTGDGRFYLLILDQSRVRVYQGNRSGMDEIEPEGIPVNLDEALGLDYSERQLQFHTRAQPRGGGERAAMFFGHGVAVDDVKMNIHRFFLAVNAGLRKLLRDDKAPLVTAGVDYLHPIFREVADYPHLVPEFITGSMDEVHEKDLHARAWSLVDPIFLRERKEDEERYHELAGTGRTSNLLSDILPAALQGRVAVLFAETDEQKWGVFDPESRCFVIHEQEQPGDEDLMNLAAVQTILNNGVVHAVGGDKVPDSGPIAALYRY